MQNNGFWVAFKPGHDLEGGIQSFDIWAFQATGQPLHVSYNYYEGTTSHFGRKFQIDEAEKLMLHTIAFDQLNNNPRLLFRFWLTSPVKGKAGQFDKALKLKPKTFFRKLTPTSWLDGEVYLYHLFAAFPAEAQLSQPELKKLKKDFKGGKRSRAGNGYLVAKAHLPDFVDLHAEKLFSSTRGKSNHEILRKQLEVFQQYLDKAVYHNLDRVYIVHGQGKGKLRSEVHRLLDEYPHVVSYNNNYQPRFGYGATEVVFG